MRNKMQIAPHRMCNDTSCMPAAGFIIKHALIIIYFGTADTQTTILSVRLKLVTTEFSTAWVSCNNIVLSCIVAPISKETQISIPVFSFVNQPVTQLALFVRKQTK